MSLNLIGDAARIAGGVALLALVIVLLLATRGVGPLGGVVSRRAAAQRGTLVDLAASRGWWAATGEEAQSRQPVAHLAAARIAPVACELVIDGGAEGFVAESWSVRVHNLGLPVGMATQQLALRVRCPGAGHFLVRGVPSRHELRYFPLEFKDRAGFVRFQVQMLVAGDFAEVQDRIGPLLDAINSSRLWVIGAGDELILMSGNEPDAGEFERRLDLARAIVDALG